MQRGRPKKPEVERRDVIMRVLLTEEEAAHVKDVALRNGVASSTWIRNLIRREFNGGGK